MLHLDSYLSDGALISVTLSLILLTGFLLTRLTRRLKLPNVTGYIFAGILLGPDVTNLISPAMLKSMDFITDIALALIAFDVGRYFSLSSLKLHGKKVLVITVMEALMAAVPVTLMMIYVFHLPVSFSLLLGAIGCATAPASTMMTVRQYHARGEFVDTMLQVVALDDAVALIAFSVCAAITQALGAQGQIDHTAIIRTLAENSAAVVAGGALGYLLKMLITDKRSPYHRLILGVALILLLTGLCAAFTVSPLLSCMVMGAVYMQCGGKKKLFKQLNRFSPPILMLFFVLSGARLDLQALATAGIIGVGYFFIRILGKYAGAWLGSRLCGASRNVSRYLGLALIPQAGVSIGLAILGQRILPAELGALLSVIILSSSVLYEIAGPAAAKLSLRLAGAIPEETRNPAQSANEGPSAQ